MIILVCKNLINCILCFKIQNLFSHTLHFDQYANINNIINIQPAECQALISKLRSCSHAELLEELKQIDAWTFGKCELFHWIDVLDLSDSILEEAAARSPDNPWELACDLPQNREVCLNKKFTY